MKRYIRADEEEYSVEYYYRIMNLLDDIALAHRELTPMERQKLDVFLAMDGGDIKDMADANDCYNEDGTLCHTWDEMILALNRLWECEDRVRST